MSLDATTFNPLAYASCLEFPDRVQAVAWQEHIPFAMALVSMVRPGVLVELGVHTGDSYLAFCQAVVSTGNRTSCYGVDSWEGDAHAGFYGPEIESELRAHHDPRYGAFSRLVKSRFDEAANYFADASVDLLHIDGFHTYDAVRADWETWRPKLSRRGVALFHDINVRERGFGVWQLWAELRSEWPHYEFVHGHGLGVLAVGPAIPDGLKQLLDLDPDERSRANAFFFSLGNRITLHASIRQREAELAKATAELDVMRRDQAETARRLEMVQAELDAARTEAASTRQEVGEIRRDLSCVLESRSYRLSRRMAAPWRRLRSFVTQTGGGQ